MWHNQGDNKFAGPEFALVGSAKYQVSGERLVMATAFHDLLQYFLTTQAGGGNFTVQQVCDKFADLSDQTVKDYTGKIWSARVSKNQMLLLPPGFVICERSLNNEACFGYRLMDFRPKLNQSFVSLIDTYIPQDSKMVKANSSAQFLVKIVQAMKSSDAPTTISSVKLEVAMKALPKSAPVAAVKPPVKAAR